MDECNNFLKDFKDFKDNDNGSKVAIFAIAATFIFSFGKYVIDSIGKNSKKESSSNGDGQI